MLFNGKYYNKPGHLGMTRAELLEKLNNGGSINFVDFEYNSIEELFISVKPADDVLADVKNGTLFCRFKDEDAYGFGMILTVDGSSVTFFGPDCANYDFDTTAYQIFSLIDIDGVDHYTIGSVNG